MKRKTLLQHFIVHNNSIKYFFRIMRISLFLLFVCVCQLLAVETDAQNVNLHLSQNSLSIKQLIKEIEAQTDYLIVFRNQDVDSGIVIHFQNRTGKVIDFLDEMYKETHIGYSFDNNYITLSRRENGIGQNAKIKVSGKVLDHLGEPIIGGSVVEKGTINGCVTDLDGLFNLEVEKSAIIQVSYIGYRTKEIVVTNQKNYVIQLIEDTQNLDEVVVVGYGVQKKVNLTGAVVSVTSEVLENKPVANIGQALQGVIPNLNISIGDGGLSTEPTYNVRGATSISGGSVQNGKPLILVDGIEMNINLLNPEDIESVSVLKDAASSAIYGARAAYGVMLITTKKGKKGEKVRVSYSNNLQWNVPYNIPDLMDSYNIQRVIMEGKVLRGLSVTSDDELFLQRLKEHRDNPDTAPVYYNNPDGTIQWVANTDPYKLAVKNAAFMQKHNVSVSGGTEKLTYYGSFGYQGQSGLYKLGDDVNNRYNALMNLSTQVTKWWNVSMKASYNKQVLEEPVNPTGKSGFWSNIAREWFNNNFMPVKTPKDSPVGEMYTNNVLSFMEYGSNNKVNRETMFFTVATEIDVLKNFKLKGDFSYKSYNRYRKQVVPELLRINTRWNSPINTHASPDYVQKWYDHNDYYTFNFYGNYDFGIKQHHFMLMGGFNQEWSTDNSFNGKGVSLLNDYVPTISQTLGDQYVEDSESHWAIRGAFFRINYNYASKYLFEMNARYDGTSKFPTKDRFKFFPSVSVGWRISEENFMEPLQHVFTNLKLRGSYGSLGNQNVDNYIYIPSYGTTTMVDHVFGDKRPVGITAPGLISNTLTWETASTIDFGVDMLLFNKLDLNFDWYNRTTRDILTAGDKLPSVLGASVPTRNSGELRTKGWELAVKWKDSFENGLRYDIGVTLSDYKTQILKFSGNPNKLISSIYEGRMMGEIWGYETEGFFQSEEEIKEAPSQSYISTGEWFPGDIRFKDLNNDGKIDQGNGTVADPGDKKIIGNSTPRYQFGITGNLFWKDFDFNVFFQGVGKRKSWSADPALWGYVVGATPLWNIYNDSWTPERRDAYYPLHAPSSSKNITQQTKYLQNSAYIRLKTLTLGYTIPRNITRKIEIDRIRVFLSGYNLFEFSGLKNKNLDPEILSTRYPMTRSYSVGVQVAF